MMPITHAVSLASAIVGEAQAPAFVPGGVAATRTLEKLRARAKKLAQYKGQPLSEAAIRDQLAQRAGFPTYDALRNMLMTGRQA